MSDQRIGISKQPNKRKKDEEQDDTCAPNKRSKRGKGGNGIGSKPGKGPKGGPAGGKGSKKGLPGQGKDPEEDTAADEGSDRENAGEEAFENESAAGDNINMDSAAGDGTRRASGDVENSADGANGGESGTDESDIEDIAGGLVGGTEDAVAGSTGEEDSVGEDMGGHDNGNGLVGGQSAADRSVRAKDTTGGPNGEDDVADPADGSTGVYGAPDRQNDIVNSSIEGDDATGGLDVEEDAGGPTGRPDAKLAAAPVQDQDVDVADGWAAGGADAADGPSAEVAACERTEGDNAKEGFEARGIGKDTKHEIIGQKETANGSTEGGEIATDEIPGVQETAAEYSDRTQDDTDVTTTQVEPPSTTIGAEDTAAQEAGQEDTAVAETARGQGDHVATKSAGGEVTIADQNAGKEDTAASGIAGEETTTPEEVVAADVLASLKTTGPLSGGNEVIVPQESPGLCLDVVNTEAGAQKNNGQRAMVEEAPENEADFSSTYQAQTSGKKTPPQESPRTPRTRAAHARFPNMLPTPPQSDLRRILHQPKGMIAHPGSPNCLVDVPSDGEIDGESGEALADQVSTYKAASHVSGDRMGTTSPDPLEKARNDTKKAIDEISTRLMKCEEIIAPPITSIPEIANRLRDIAAEMAGPYKRLRALKERAIMLHGQARR